MMNREPPPNNTDIAVNILLKDLFKAASEGHVESVRTSSLSFVMEYGAMAKAADDDGATILHYACGWKTILMIRKFFDVIADRVVNPQALDKHFKVWYELLEEFRTSAAKQFPDTTQVVKLLLERGANCEAFSVNGMTPLICASLIGRLDLVDLLLEAKASINSRCENGNTALIFAAGVGNVDVVQALLERGADVAVDVRGKAGDTALILAAKCGHDDVIKALLRYGDINARDDYGGTALIHATLRSHAKAFHALMDKNPDLDAADEVGNTALMYAAMNNNVEMVQTLLMDSNGRRERLNTTNIYGKTALIHAASKGCTDVVRRLLLSGADYNAKDFQGKTALLWAVQFGYVEIAELLLLKGADVNIRDNEGNYPLILAIRWDLLPTADDILTSGQLVDVNAENTNKESALSVALQKGDMGLVSSISEMVYNYKTIMADPRGLNQHRTDDSEQASIAGNQDDVDAAQEKGRISSQNDGVPSGSSSSVSSSLSVEEISQVPPSALTNMRSVLSAQWTIPLADLQIGPQIGEGSFARVHKANWKGAEVAVKSFYQSVADPKPVLSSVHKEANLLASVRYPQIVQFLGVCSDLSYMVTEYCSRGSLLSILNKAQTDSDTAKALSWERRLQMAADASSALLYLHQHEKSIIHGDIKSPNLLVTSDWRIKVCDLGIAKLLEEAVSSKPEKPVTCALNPRWLAPEIARDGGEGRTVEGDIYALGLVLWELLTWELPWSHLGSFNRRGTYPKIWYALAQGEQVPIPALKLLPGPKPESPDILDEYVVLLKECIDGSPEARPAASEVVERLKALASEETKHVKAREQKEKEIRERTIYPLKPESAAARKIKDLMLVCFIFIFFLMLWLV